MNVNRSDVVLVDYPYSSGGGTKVRPALVVQSDLLNRRIANTIIAMITSRTDRVATDASQLLIDISTPEGGASGLKMNSAVTCANLFTINTNDVLKTIGSLSQVLMDQIDASIKFALELP